ncbi:hypothetical protein IFM89_013130 [Coptis chinensis]|uniref:Pectate lyase n=1 Tax=Coptis chinensis TaxID=261450 RepID=A0A835LMV9_9MAGN|nr:hypothetical protein IFM89_013130 [Coptis chinensis]
MFFVYRAPSVSPPHHLLLLAVIHIGKNIGDVLLNRVIGFGRNAVGGRDGHFYVVTDPSDNGVVNPRLAHYAMQSFGERHLWIIFKSDMVITLKQELLMSGFKTIDARGVSVHIAGGACITLQYISNVIIHGINIHDCKSTGNPNSTISHG